MKKLKCPTHGQVEPRHVGEANYMCPTCYDDELMKFFQENPGPLAEIQAKFATAFKAKTVSMGCSVGSS